MEHPKIIGIKEALADSQRIHDLVALKGQKRQEFILLSGDDPTFCYAMQQGFNGVISVAANVIPKVALKFQHFVRPKILMRQKSLICSIKACTNFYSVNPTQLQLNGC